MLEKVVEIVGGMLEQRRWKKDMCNTKEVAQDKR